MTATAKKVAHFFVTAHRRRIAQKAASLSFYTLVSVFPAGILTLSLLSRFVSPALVKEQVTHWVQEIVPGQAMLILGNVSSLFERQKNFTFWGVLGLVIVSAVFYLNLESIIIELSGSTKKRSFVIRRLFYFVWLIGMLAVLFSPFAMQWFLNWVSDTFYRPPYFDWVVDNLGFGFMSLVFFCFVLLIVPLDHPRLNPKRFISAAFLFSFILILGKTIFVWYTAHNLRRYNLIYGSLSSVMIVLLWVFYFYTTFLYFVYWVGEEAKGEESQFFR